MELFGGSISMIERGLNFSADKSKAIAQNVANADTPNYKAKTVDFKSYLNEAKASQPEAYRTDKRHLPFSPSSAGTPVRTYANFRFNQNGNGVDMDKEQADLAANQIYYSALVDRMSSKFNSLNNVIKGGR
ncbi:flagellar basal body rod protein FlgB [Sporosarcina sp. NCCP-2716]|uniref:flagellar basal body rod protein FlgB n=1 Tax=Sporosarcina sp. NCCP-2716 TaxID=2943679 RepID=UPI002041400C|nr:flagellar basal body rod protein FlgB [Sporosarcina sp. NCCP-2716]GKV67792.1 flagellar basal body rod protein FlgB [Sporosarcina sp. NCCP-2716]